jgi:(2S)-methylsuccinyl-CoA dehydrogenase
MNTISQTPQGRVHLLASGFLQQIRTQLALAIKTLAQRCTLAGKLDTNQLDAWQPACYELAWASAELLAADTALAKAPVAADLDGRLALVFAADAMLLVLQRLEPLALDIGMDRSPLLELAGSEAFAQFRKTVVSTQALCEIGSDVAKRQGDIAHISLDEDVTMAQDAFRRFAAEQVAPMAAQIHRDDLTVPESLLQPLRFRKSMAAVRRRILITR